MRETGWYWVKDDVEGWHPAQWLGRWCSPYVIQHGGLKDSYYLEIGQRIPPPDEFPHRDDTREQLLEIHRVTACVVECPPVRDEDWLTTRRVKNMAALIKEYCPSPMLAELAEPEPRHDQ